MVAIEAITSVTTRVEVVDNFTNTKQFIEVPRWNETVANLTLMALGSSAPEILLNVLDTIGTLGEPANPIGPFTIVGSAAFNLLCITAVCIPAVSEPKKVLNTGVFAITSILSLWAYLWLLICLSFNSPGKVDIAEAWITFLSFFLLVIVAFGADKWFYKKMDSDKDDE